MHSFQLRLKQLKSEIKHWNIEEFGNIHQNQIRLKEKMKEIQQSIILHGRTEDLALEEGRIVSEQKREGNKKRFYGNKNPGPTG
jgi:hypothetical protein